MYFELLLSVYVYINTTDKEIKQIQYRNVFVMFFVNVLNIILLMSDFSTHSLACSWKQLMNVNAIKVA